MTARPATAIHPVTPKRWPDLEKLFGPNGAYSNCWCMERRVRLFEFRALTPAERKAGLRRWVRSGAEPGLLAYRNGTPAAWCAVAPRSEYAGLATSRKFKPVDDAAGIWSMTCFFVAKEHRRTGLMSALLAAAMRHAKRRGASILEGYPVVAANLKGCDGYTGLVPIFERAGFKVVAQRSRRIRVMRKTLSPRGSREHARTRPAST